MFSASAALERKEPGTQNASNNSSAEPQSHFRVPSQQSHHQDSKDTFQTSYSSALDDVTLKNFTNPLRRGDMMRNRTEVVQSSFSTWNKTVSTGNTWVQWQFAPRAGKYESVVPGMEQTSCHQIGPLSIWLPWDPLHDHQKIGQSAYAGWGPRNLVSRQTHPGRQWQLEPRFRLVSLESQGWLWMTFTNAVMYLWVTLNYSRDDTPTFVNLPLRGGGREREMRTEVIQGTRDLRVWWGMFQSCATTNEQIPPNIKPFWLNYFSFSLTHLLHTDVWQLSYYLKYSTNYCLTFKLILPNRSQTS